MRKITFALIMSILGLCSVSAGNETLLSEWNAFIKKESCMVGGQIWYHNTDWRLIISNNYPALKSFLFSRFPKHSPTMIHRCPFYEATEGELALYAVEWLTRTEWTSYDGSNKKLKTLIGLYNNPTGHTGGQKYLRKALRDPACRTELVGFFSSKEEIPLDQLLTPRPFPHVNRDMAEEKRELIKELGGAVEVLNESPDAQPGAPPDANSGRR